MDFSICIKFNRFFKILLQAQFHWTHYIKRQNFLHKLNQCKKKLNQIEVYLKLFQQLLLHEYFQKVFLYIYIFNPYGFPRTIPQNYHGTDIPSDLYLAIFKLMLLKSFLAPAGPGIERRIYYLRIKRGCHYFTKCLPLFPLFNFLILLPVSHLWIMITFVVINNTKNEQQMCAWLDSGSYLPGVC